MKKVSFIAGIVSAGAAFAGAPLHAQTMEELATQLTALRAELAQQRARVDYLERQIRAAASAPAVTSSAPVPATIPAVPRQTLFDAGGGAQAGTAPPEMLAGLRGAGASGAAGDDAVGRAPRTDNRPPEVAPIFEQPGVLTPRGKYVLEPALQFGYSSSNRIALVGYTIIPALLIGLVDVREVKRNSTTASVTVRRGMTNRLELELKVPYVYRSDATVSRELFTGTAVERVFETSGKAIGDIEIAGRYQINNGGVDTPYFIGGLRFKTRTGRDPFEVVTDCTGLIGHRFLLNRVINREQVCHKCPEQVASIGGKCVGAHRRTARER